MSLQYIKAVGPVRAAALKKIGIETIQQLLYYLPYDYLDRSRILPIKELPKFVETGNEVTVIGTVYRTKVAYTRNKKKIFFLTLKDATGYLTCVFYAGIEWYQNAFESEEILAVSSVPEFDKLNRIQFIHPEFDRLKTKDNEDDTDWNSLLHTGAIIPKYSSSEELRKVGLDNRGFRRILRNALQHNIAEIKEHLPTTLLPKHNLMKLQNALQSVHFPKNYSEKENSLRRLKFDELLYFQLLIAYRKRELKGELRGISFDTKSTLVEQLLSTLPFTLTEAQQRVIKEIHHDMQSNIPMNRLVQGDVGSGKTIVALIAILTAIDNGFQAVLMAPTEILAEQHFYNITNLLQNTFVNVRLLVGGQKKKLREDILEDIRRGTANIIIGTHALLQEHVQFSNLGFVVIDEQHRFGVAQRALLREKGKQNPDVLVMTATPIPRTLSLTVYGDLDVSVIDELPKNRKPIRTVHRTEKEKEKIFAFVKEEIQKGRQCYIVYPLIEESEKIDLKAATAEYNFLKEKIFPELRIGLLHGRLSSEEKDFLMKQFKNRELDILVSTTVIEVGIDVPNATIMIIENAERFGLSQLHQLRGRVGRGAEQSYCILITNENTAKKNVTLSSNRKSAYQEKMATQKRIQTMVATNDGFKIAEVDLEIRGAGDFFGTRQSGLPNFKVANIVSDTEILSIAREEAFAIVATDPHLRLPEHQHIRHQFETVFKEFLSFVRVG